MYIHEIEPFFSIDLCFISQACYLPKYIVSYCEGHQTYFKSLNSNESSEAQKSNLTQLCVFKHVYGNTGNKGYFNYCLLSVKLGYFWSICRIFSQPKQGEFRLSPEKSMCRYYPRLILRKVVHNVTNVTKTLHYKMSTNLRNKTTHQKKPPTRNDFWR